MRRIHKDLIVAVLTQEQHARTCNYWYVVQESSMPHTAFTAEAGLRRWLEERGLSLSEPLTEPGTHSWQRIVGEYATDAHYGPNAIAEFEALAPIVESRTLSNGDYVVAKITQDADMRTVHTLNPNVPRVVFDYRESAQMMNPGRRPALAR